MLKIVTVPNPVLRQVSKPVRSLDRAVNRFLKELSHTLLHKKDPPGVGISAIQVGKPWRIILTLMPEGESRAPEHWQPNQLKITTFINPLITGYSKSITLGDNPDKPYLEGCLSVPQLYGPVWRYQCIDIAYQTPSNGQLTDQTTRLTGFPARVFQHEYDHLEGILFTDYVMGISPAKNFRPLGAVDQLYFDQAGELTPIQDPTKIVTW